METELKFELELEAAAKLNSCPLLQLAPAEPPVQLESTYFETPDRALQERQASLRVRRQGERLIQTIKAEIEGGSLFERSEWECDLADDTPDRALFAGTPLADLSEDTELAPLFVSKVERTIHRLERNGTQIELSIDRGSVEGRGSDSLGLPKVDTFVELELELKQGDPKVLFEVARELNASTPLRLGLITKCGRGYSLVDGTGAELVKAEAIHLDPDMPVRDAFKALGRECIRHHVGNLPLLLQHRQTESVHQMRVAIRRLRAAMSLFRSVLDDPESARIKEELRWIGRQFGEARNLDVFIEDVIEPMLENHPDEPGMRELLEYFRTRREEAYDKVTAIARDARYGAAIIDTLAWIETGDWADTERGEDHADLLTRPVRTLAADELSRRWRKIYRKGRRLKALPAESRHKLRIDIKKVRYAAEFFSGLYTGRKADRRRKRLQALLSGLQDSLGELNDMAVNHKAEVELTRVEGRGGPAVARRRAFAAGLLAGHQFTRVQPLLRTAVKDYGRFRKAEPFWTK